MPVGVDVSVFVNKLIELGVNFDLAASMGNALSDNNLRLFEQLVHTVDVTNQVEVQSLVRNHMENMLNNNKLFESVSILTGDSATSLAAVGCMGTIVFAMIFKDGVPCSLIAFVLVLMFGAFMALRWVSSYADKLRNVVTRLKKPQTAVLARIPHASLDNGFCTAMLERGRATEEVSVAVVDKVVSMQAMSVMYGISQVCANVVNAVQGCLDDGASFSGLAKNKAAAQERVKVQVARMKESTNEIRKVTYSAVDSIVKTSEHAETWSDEVQAFDNSLTRQLAKLPRRPDLFLTAAESDRKTRILDGIERDAKNLCALFNKGFDEIDCQLDVDTNMVRENCDNMIRALAFSPDMVESQARAVQEAIENRSKVSAELASVAGERAAHEVKLRGFEAKQAIARTTFFTKLVELESSMMAQKETLKQLGSGTVTMTGRPPSSDPIAQELYNDWNAGRWKKLYPYRSGTSFSIVIDSNLTPKQRQGKENLERIVDQIDALKVKHQEEMQSLDAKLSNLKSCTKIKLDSEREAEEAVERVKAKNVGTWADFSMSNPVEYSQIQLLYQINDCILKVAEWSFRLDPGLADIKALSRELARADNFHPEQLQAIVWALKERLDTPRDSVVAFVKNVGTAALRRALKPSVGSVAFAKESLDKCMAVMDSNTRQRHAVEID